MICGLPFFVVLIFVVNLKPVGLASKDCPERTSEKPSATVPGLPVAFGMQMTDLIVVPRRVELLFRE
jgi:hypothetical protein